MTKEKNLASSQKQENQRLKKTIAHAKKYVKSLKKRLSQSQCDKSDVPMDILKKENEELKLKVERLEKERDAETKKTFQCQSENISNRETILELKTTQSKLTSDLEICESTDADLLISDKELKECNEELKAEMKKNVQCESEKKICQEKNVSNAKILSELQSGSAEHIVTKQELHDCEEELEDEIRKNKNLQTTASTSRRRAQECQTKLDDEIEAKEKLQEKFESFRPSWGEWSACSKNCPGVKTRMDKCSLNSKETKPCSDNCSKSGKSVGS